MAVTMNTINVNQNTNFKGSYSRTEQGNQYYKTSAGTTAGAVLAVPAFALNAMGATEDSKKYGNMYREMGLPEEKVAKAEKMLNKEFKNIKKLSIPAAIVAAACTLGSGMIVDHIRNKRAKEVADLTKQVGVKGAMMQGEGVAISQRGRTYYDSNVGSKYGALLGAGCGVVAIGFSLLQNKGSNILKEANKIPGFKSYIVIGSIMNIGLFALGGWLMGKLADHNTNKAAERKA